MKIENLSEGQTYKNYKALCESLEMPVKKANSKKAQLKELERFCKLQQTGHQITITEVYDVPEDKVENRGKKSVYGDMIQFLVADILARSKQKHLTISRNKLLLTVNMINENYGFCGYNVKKLAEYTSIEEAVIYDFFNTSNSSLKGAIETALNNLHKKRVVWFEKVIKVRETSTRTHRLATDEEKSIIFKCEKIMLDSLGYEDIESVRTSKDWKLFKRETESLMQEKANLDFYYYAYKIGIDDDYIEEERNKLMNLVLENSKRMQLRGELNATVIENFKKNAENRHKTAFTSKKMGKYRIDSGYVGKINKLIDLVIDESKENIHKDVTEIYNNDLNIAQQLEEMEIMFG